MQNGRLAVQHGTLLWDKACCCLSCAAFGLIFMGLIPYMGCLFAAAITRVQLHFFSLICECKSQSPSGLIQYFSTVSFLLYICNFLFIKKHKRSLGYFTSSLSLCLSVPTPLSLFHSFWCHRQC